MKHFLILFCLFLNGLFSGSAQEHKPDWLIGVNPFSLFEPLSNIGPCAEVRVSPSVGFWAEASYIFRNQYQLNDWEKVRGNRFIFQPRFYIGKRKFFFVAPEFRLKRFNYTIGLDFVNAQTQDTLKNYIHRATQAQTGGGLVIGFRSWLSRKHNLTMEFTSGLGAKNRQITRKNIPSGYQFEHGWDGFGLAPHYEWDNDVALYIPCSIRLVWKLESGWNK